MSKVVIAATEPEVSFMVARLQCRTIEPVPGTITYHAQQHGDDLYIVISGPGIANAAAAAAAAIERYSPQHIFNVGVCGVYADDVGLLAGAVAGTRAVFADAGCETDKVFQPLEAMDLPLSKTGDDTHIYNTIELHHAGVSREVTRAALLTLSAVSGSSRRASVISNRFKGDRQELQCEDMESAAVGLIALKASIPCTVVRGISNVCGERDRTKWKLAEAAQAAQQVLLTLL